DHRRPYCREVRPPRIACDDNAFNHAVRNMRFDPRTYIRRRENGPNTLQRIGRHARASNTENKMGFVAAIVQAACESEAKTVRGARIDPTNVTLLKINSLAICVDVQAHCNAIERHPLIVG